MDTPYVGMRELSQKQMAAANEARFLADVERQDSAIRARADAQGEVFGRMISALRALGVTHFKGELAGYVVELSIHQEKGGR